METAGETDTLAVQTQELNACALVRCFAAPICATGQHVVYTPQDCCGRCVGSGGADRCATVLCAAVMCPEGQQRVYSAGNCCGVCMPVPL